MTQFEQRMGGLRARFVQRCSTETAALREAFRLGDHTALRRIAHSLAGNAGLFGFPELSVRARELEDVLDRTGSGQEIQTKLEAVFAGMPDEPVGGSNVQGE